MMMFLKRRTRSPIFWAGITACLAVLSIWQYWELYERHRSESLCNWYKTAQFERNGLTMRTVEASRQNRQPMTNKEYYSDTWPSMVYLPNKTCIGLSDMGIGQSETRCYDDKSEKLLMTYVVPDEGPPYLLNGDKRVEVPQR